MENNPVSLLEETLRAGRFAVTAEIGPPKSADAEVIRHKAESVRGSADAYNVTDNQTAIARLGSIATSHILLDLGLEPVVQMTCRDRNRLAIQSDLLGAHALGIRNVLCLTGDHVLGGNHPQAREVYDLDSITLLQMVRGMTEGRFQSGDPLEPAPDFFIGAVENPFAPPYEFRPLRLQKKAQAGARFIQTQMIFNVGRFREFMTRIADLGLAERLYILAGVGPLKSPGMAHHMRDHVAGLEVPDEIIRRMEGAPKARWRDEGLEICLEIISQLREIPGVAGIHVMSIDWEEAVPQIVGRAGLLPRSKRADPIPSSARW